MGKVLSGVVTACALTAALVTSAALFSPPALAAGTDEGKALSEDRKKGNCLACHLITGANLPGNIGPPLTAMKARFPDKAALKAQIHDPTVKNPNSLMPPFGRHGVLTSEEIDKVVEYILTL
jgi:sulfur-oxidizing protein SoxX